jgi:hypothetical protein
MAADSVRNRLESALSDLEATSAGELSDDAARLVTNSLGAALQALTESIGECRQDVPYSTLRPIIGDDGQMRWCCNHESEHCA